MMMWRFRKASTSRSDQENGFAAVQSNRATHTFPRGRSLARSIVLILHSALDMIYSLLIINKAGGLIYNREYNEGISRLSSNDYLVLAGTFHGYRLYPPTASRK